ncbi:MAG: polysaccharide deacetylase family protein [Thermoflavifilum sp.]|nr:polysaccharide deacetylase family protein [Thermoflavifilum sp.]
MLLLSFDLEEFDLPLEYGYTIPLSDQLAITTEGLQRLLETLSKYEIKATFYTTVRYAAHRPQWVNRLIQEKHELASHGLHHGKLHPADVALSREKLSTYFGVPIYGFRMPRMQSIDERLLIQSGYRYHSSVHPTWIPGRYCHISAPRQITRHEQLIHIPPSVSRHWRIPLFWLSFHLLPEKTYTRLCKQTLETDGYLHLYFHPWEWGSWPKKLYKHLPLYLRVENGYQMKNKFDRWIEQIRTPTLYGSTTIDWLQKQWGNIS